MPCWQYAVYEPKLGRKVESNSLKSKAWILAMKCNRILFRSSCSSFGEETRCNNEEYKAVQVTIPLFARLTMMMITNT